MPIGIVSEDDFLSEVGRMERNPVPELKPAQIPLGEIIDIHRGGRSEGDLNVPQVIRDIVIDEVVENGRASALAFANMVGVSPSSVSAYTNGTNSTASYNVPNKLTNSKLKEAKLRVASKARRKLNLAIENITEDKLMEASLKDLALVAKSMSGVIKDMEPSTDKLGEVNFNGPSIVMYNPGFTKEESFDTVEVSE